MTQSNLLGIVIVHNIINYMYIFHSLLTNVNLPEGEAEFFETLNIYFPKVTPSWTSWKLPLLCVTLGSPQIYDIKYLMKSCKNLKGGLQVEIFWSALPSEVFNCKLQEVADTLEVKRIGPQHQVEFFDESRLN